MGLCGSCYRGGFVLVPRNLLNYRSVGGSSSPPPPRSFLGIEGRAPCRRVTEKRLSGPFLSLSIRFRFPRFNSPFKRSYIPLSLVPGF